jgi:DNA-binding NtrC family response regulator
MRTIGVVLAPDFVAVENVRVFAVALVLPGSMMPTEPHADPPGAILLVDDEDGVREYARKVLELAGYTVQPAESADAAERLFRRDPAGVALLLTDVIMPGRTGPELARDLRAIRPGLGVLYISGYVGGAGPLPNGSPLLEKPFTPDALMAAVRRAIGPSRPG